jgi:hypothetical protein
MHEIPQPLISFESAAQVFGVYGSGQTGQVFIGQRGHKPQSLDEFPGFLNPEDLGMRVE